MEIREALRSVFQEMILPELDQMKNQQVRIDERLDSMDKRLSDINAHLIDQSRRIDETNKRIDSLRGELVRMIADVTYRIDQTTQSIARLYEVIVRKEDHFRLERDFQDLRKRVEILENKLAA